ncbi:type VI secretion system membrane subunit TssM [Ruegeria jejuensis]|uniref:type VI secretion system membrane subunit TssM n=1 Tax=Ruegeria jejuensis TaxID=3233338 RepID=UPI00355C375E
MNPLGMWTSFRSQMDSYLGVVGRRFLVLVWLIAICVLIWVFGPRLAYGDFAPLAPARNRLIAIAIVLVLGAIWQLLSWRRARKADAQLVEDATQSPGARAAEETQEEINDLRDRLREAMKLMRKVARQRVGYVYEFPWYLMIGAPGAGKTTLLTNSGLKFPLGDAMGAEPVQGVGGTRNCNWWFTDRAILIDTAGRYTTQDSQRERDAQGFLGFLSMLRKRRPAQPINGVVLTLSLTDLLTQEPDQRLREVRAIRQRLAEIEDTLKARVPVYIVLTKADRLNGFATFFEDLGGQSREQVWGMTFDFEKAERDGDLPEMFSHEYSALQDRLNGLLLERLQQETDIDRRGAIFRFPAQIAALHDSLREIVEELASGTATVSAPLIRGLYFASATQDAEARRIPGAPARAMNRSYFVSRLFSDVILGEAALIARDRRVSQRRKIVIAAGYALLALVVLGLSISWTSSYLVNHRALVRADDTLARYATRARNIPTQDVRDRDFLRVLPALNTLETTPAVFDAEAEQVPLYLLGFGLGQERRINARYQDLYAAALGTYLQPRYMVALQDRLKSDDLTEAEAFETLKHYLSLAGYGPVDADALLAQAEDVFATLYPGPGRAPTRVTLHRHLEAMLQRGDLPVLEIDTDLVAKTRETIANRSPAQRTLDLLATRTETRALPGWSVAGAVGPAASDAFERMSGTALTEPIPGLYTSAGYQGVLLPQVGTMAEIAAQEDWVRGAGGSRPDDVSEIARNAVELYWTQFSDMWRDTVSDIRIRAVASLGDGADLLLLLSSEADPLQRLATDIVDRTDLIGPLSVAPEGFDASALSFDPAAAPDLFGPLRRALASEADAGEETAEGFAALTPQFDGIYQQLNRVNASDARAAEVFAAESQLNEGIQELVASARALPGPADAWLTGLAGSLAASTVERARDELSAIWAAGPAQQCLRAVAGRYPFDRQQSREVTLDDFTRIFGPDGVFDSFFAANLDPFVDRSTNPWSWKGGLGTAGDSSEALAQFQRAAQIRTAFFPAGATHPEVGVDFDLIGSSGDPSTVQVGLGGEISVYGFANAPRRPLIWPGQNPGRAFLRALPSARSNDLVINSDWSAFRLIDRAQRITPVSRNEFDAAFQVAGYGLRFRITADSVNNPFELEAMSAFSCPRTLME